MKKNLKANLLHKIVKTRNPATGETMVIPAKKSLKFRIAKQAKDAVVPPKK